MDPEIIAAKLEELGVDGVFIQGQDVMCLCPFHPDHKPSFGVHPDRGANCFACLVRFHSADAALEAIANKWDMEYTPIHQSLPPGFDLLDIPEDPEPQPLNPGVINFYNKDVKRFEDEWGCSREVVENRRLCIDPSTNAECFPIFDKHNNYWGMVERHVSDDGSRRYHYPANYPRRNILFGEDKAEEHPEDVWVVEGVRDLCAVETKVPGVVCVAIGSARVSDKQLDTLMLCDKITLALDNDEAGRRGRDYILNKLPQTKVNVAKFKGKDPVDASEFEVREGSRHWLTWS